MHDRLQEIYSRPLGTLDQRIVDAKECEIRSAVSFLRDTVGCLVRDTSVAHLQKVIADRIEILCDFSNKRAVLKINGHDLYHTVTGFQFRYLGERDFPVCSLMFKPRAVAIDCEPPVFREDEHLMRAGIVLEAQSDDTTVCVRTGARNRTPSLVVDYTEERLVLDIGGTDVSHMAVTFVVGAHFPSRTVSLGSLGLRFQ